MSEKVLAWTFFLGSLLRHSAFSSRRFGADSARLTLVIVLSLLVVRQRSEKPPTPRCPPLASKRIRKNQAPRAGSGNSPLLRCIFFSSLRILQCPLRYFYSCFISPPELARVC